MMNQGNTPSEGDRVSGAGGFSLIEIIVTLVVLSIASIGVLSVFSVGIGGSANPLLVSQATQLAQGEMDQVLGEKAANGFASVAIGASLPCVSNMLAGFTCSRATYYVNSGALNTSVGGPTNYIHVTVTISQATINNLSLNTIIAKY